MIHMKELLPLTGYIRGGCSPVGMKKKFPTYIEETAVLFDKIAVSAGMRGVQVMVNPGELAGLHRSVLRFSGEGLAEEKERISCFSQAKELT